MYGERRVVLLDLPKKCIGVNSATFEIQGGFRGLRSLYGDWNVVSYLDGDWTAPTEIIFNKHVRTVVLRAEDGRLVPVDEPRYMQLAESGAMDEHLLTVGSYDAFRMFVGERTHVWSNVFDAIDSPRSQKRLPLEGPDLPMKNFLNAPPYRRDKAAVRAAQELLAAYVLDEPDALVHLEAFWRAVAEGWSLFRDRPVAYEGILVSIRQSLELFKELRPLSYEWGFDQLVQGLRKHGRDRGQLIASDFERIYGR